MKTRWRPRGKRNDLSERKNMNEVSEWVSEWECVGAGVRTVQHRANHLRWHSSTCSLLRQEAVTLDGKWATSNKRSKSPQQSFIKKDDGSWIRGRAVILMPEELFLMLFTVFLSKQNDPHQKEFKTITFLHMTGLHIKGMTCGLCADLTLPLWQTHSHDGLACWWFSRLEDL